MQPALTLDLRLLRVLRTRAHSPGFEAAVDRFSKLGEHGGIWIVGALAGAAGSDAHRPAFLRATRSITLAYLANQLIKLAAGRERPSLADLPPLTRTASNLSYPSAHASTSFAGAHSLSRPLPPLPLYLLATALALSRPYLGVHYPSDVMAGAALGTAVAVLAE